MDIQPFLFPREQSHRFLTSVTRKSQTIPEAESGANSHAMPREDMCKTQRCLTTWPKSEASVVCSHAHHGKSSNKASAFADPASKKLQMRGTCSLLQAQPDNATALKSQHRLPEDCTPGLNAPEPPVFMTRAAGKGDRVPGAGKESRVRAARLRRMLAFGKSACESESPPSRRKTGMLT